MGTHGRLCLTCALPPTPGGQTEKLYADQAGNYRDCVGQLLVARDVSDKGQHVGAQ